METIQKKLLYTPPSKPRIDHEIPNWIEDEEVDEKIIQQILIMNIALCLKYDINDDIINGFFRNSNTSFDPRYEIICSIMDITN